MRAPEAGARSHLGELRLDADLVVLSACNAALGHGMGGEVAGQDGLFGWIGAATSAIRLFRM